MMSLKSLLIVTAVVVLAITCFAAMSHTEMTRIEGVIQMTECGTAGQRQYAILSDDGWEPLIIAKRADAGELEGSLAKAAFDGRKVSVIGMRETDNKFFVNAVMAGPEKQTVQLTGNIELDSNSVWVLENPDGRYELFGELTYGLIERMTNPETAYFDREMGRGVTVVGMISEQEGRREIEVTRLLLP